MGRRKDETYLVDAVPEGDPSLGRLGLELLPAKRDAQFDLQPEKTQKKRKRPAFYRFSLLLPFEAPSRRAICPAMLRRRSQASQMPPAGCNLPL